MNRPLALFTGFFVLGEVLRFMYGIGEVMAFAAIFIAVIIFAVMLFWSFRNKALFWFCFLIPAFIIGIVRMGTVEKEIANIPVISGNIAISGKVYKIKETKRSYAIYLENVQVINNEVKDKEQDQFDRVLVYYNDIKELKIGNTVNVYGEIEIMPKGSNIGQFSPRDYYVMEKIYYRLYALRSDITCNKSDWFREGLRNIRIYLINIIANIAPNKDAGMYGALLLGENSGIDEERERLYRITGLSHLLVISGMHIAMIGRAIYKLVRKFIGGFKISVLCAVFFTYAYCIMIEGGAAINRALIMFIILMLANALGRTYDMITTMSVTAGILFMENPMLLKSVGVQFSFGAVFAIAIVYPILQSYCSKECKGSKIWDSIILNLAVQSIILPICIYHFFEYPIYTIIISIFMIPLMDIIVYFAGGGLIAGCISLMLGRFIIGTGAVILKVNDMICELTDKLPFARILIGRPDPWKIVIYYMIIAGTFFIMYILKNNETKLKDKASWRINLLVVSLAFLFIYGSTFAVLRTDKLNKLRITFLDVEQGDGIVIENPNGSVSIIDCGSSTVSELAKYRLVPYLMSRGHNRVDNWYLSHMDKDHVSAILEVLKNYDSIGVKIKRIFITTVMSKSDKSKELIELALNEDIEIMIIDKGDIINDGLAQIRILHPEKNILGLNDNEASMVMEYSYGDFIALFTGDVEARGEDILVRSQLLNDYTLLKVGHHGSLAATSDELLKIIRPEMSVISAGFNNTYGHPRADVLNRLENISSEIYRTDYFGAITIETDGNNVWYDSFLDRAKGR
jgi:DNA internalization-related competence protein ComEC/Rec2